MSQVGVQTHISAGRTKSGVGAPILLVVVALAFGVTLAAVLGQLAGTYGYQRIFFVLEREKAAAAAITVALAALSVPRGRDARSLLCVIALFASTIPTSVVVAAGGGTYRQLLAGAAVFFVVRAAPTLDAGLPGLRRLAATHIIDLATVMSVITCVLVLLFSGSGVFSLSFYGVYEFRRATAAGLPTVVSYLWPQVVYALIPVASVLCCQQARWLRLGFLTFSTLLLFGALQHKGILLAAVLPAAVYLLARRRDAVASIAITSLVAIVATYLWESIGGQGVSPLADLLARRTLLVPAVLDREYLEFFSHEGHIWWADSRLTFGLMESPYRSTAPFVIGENVFGRSDLAANSGVIGSGYANGGWFGVGVYTVGLALFVGWIRRVGLRVGPGLAVASSTPVFINVVTSSDFAAALLSGGIATLVLLLSSVPAQANGDQSSATLFG